MDEDPIVSTTLALTQAKVVVHIECVKQKYPIMKECARHS